MDVSRPVAPASAVRSHPAGAQLQAWPSRQQIQARPASGWKRAAGPAAAPAHRQRDQRVQAAAEAERGGSATAEKQQAATTRRIVVAVDASEDSIDAFTWVIKNLVKPGDELHLLHVVPDVFTSPASGSIYYCSSPDPEMERALWQQAKSFFVDNFLEHAKAEGLEDCCWLHLVKESRHKHIGKAVCKKADELGAEPLVLAAHDRSALEKMFLGSVSDYCVTHSKRPVLLLHPHHSALE
ncbi:hypothetical protein COHA_003088 [Chlorella ohadii]|uniref:UspA domain-containing protein n=1 Tax=Chlorella ohadii TaxID=2649997 RepID=A0AAD5DZC8_9CHLO|nr:hypothetical protein COHA_003088 [Chlorella ohadii]